MNFTAKQAIEDSKSGRPIILSNNEADRICQEHDTMLDSFFEKFPRAKGFCLDASDLFVWLGYSPLTGIAK